MSTYGIPTDGVYRIYIPSDNPLYMELNESDSLIYVRSRNEQSNNQKWNIRQVSGKANTYKITSFNNQRTVNWKPGSYYGSLFVDAGATTEWIVEYKSPQGPRLTTSDKKSQGHYVDSCDSKTAHFYSNNPSGVAQHWAFEQVQGGTPPGSSSGLAPGNFKDKFFGLTVEEAATGEYDIIIVGSGIGGGVLANDLWDTNQKVGTNAKRVLLLEKGDLVFHSHCLNTARPAGLTNDRGQQNDTFFHNFKEDFKFDPPISPDEWKGGAMYNLGGRSAAWGLFAPRIHDKNMGKNMEENIVRELKEEYYDRAERLMLLSLPNTKRVHQHLMDRLNIGGLDAVPQSNVQWQWGRIASEFHDDRNFDFAEGAYSTIDKLLEIAMSRSNDAAGKPIEHEHFKTVLNADVRSLKFDSGNTVVGVNVRTRDRKMVTIPVKKDASVVLCAGSVQSPAILLRSGADWASKLEKSRGLRLTDHDIFYYSASFRYNDPKQRAEVGAMKLQTNCMLDDEIALANMSVDASSFLPRAASPDESVPQCIFVYILQRALVDLNGISIDPKTDEPVVEMQRGEDPRRPQQEAMQKLTASAIDAIRDSLGANFLLPEHRVPKVDWQKIKLNKLQLGGVAHELGTLPMYVNKSTRYCLDTNLRLKDQLCKGVYVCDLSIFPWSPEANPTLCLAALAIRLSRHLNKRITVQNIPGSNTITVVNHSGSRLKVWLTAYKPDGTGGQAEPPRILESGKDVSWTRDTTMPQGLFIFRRDRATTDENAFLSTPEIQTVQPGKVNTVHATSA